MAKHDAVKVEVSVRLRSQRHKYDYDRQAIYNSAIRDDILFVLSVFGGH